MMKKPHVVEGVNLDVLMPEKAPGVGMLPGIVRDSDKVPRKNKRRRVQEVPLASRVIRRSDVQGTMLLIRRLFASSTQFLLDTFIASCQKGDLDISIGWTGCPWDSRETIRVRSSVIRPVVEWVLDDRRTPWGPFQPSGGRSIAEEEEVDDAGK